MIEGRGTNMYIDNAIFGDSHAYLFSNEPLFRRQLELHLVVREPGRVVFFFLRVVTAVERALLLGHGHEDQEGDESDEHEGARRRHQDVNEGGTGRPTTRQRGRRGRGTGYLQKSRVYVMRL